MKRKLNESLASTVKIDVISLANDYPELLGQLDDIASEIETADDNVVVTNDNTEPGTCYMVISGLTEDEIIDIFTNEYSIDDIEDYFVNTFDDYDSVDEAYGLDDDGEWIDIPEDDDEYESDDDIDSDDYPAYDEELDDIESDIDAHDAAEADMRDEYGDDYIDSDDYPAYDDVDECCDTDECCDDDCKDELNDCEDQEFECYESAHRHNLRNRKRLNEKKGSCCPGKKNRMISLNEAVKRSKELSISDIVKSAKNDRKINENTLAAAMKKARLDSINELKEALGEKKFNLIVKSLKEGKKTLYTKKVINGKNITEYKNKELLNILNLVKEQYNTLVKSYKSLNESASNTTRNELRDSIDNKYHFMELLDEELTYRLTLKKLLKEAEEVKEEEEEKNPLEPLPVDPIPMGDEDSDDEPKDDEPKDDDSKDDDSKDDSTEGDEDPEEDETVELSRVVITLANQEAADELKQSLIDAGVPEDALEIEDESTDDSEEETSDEDNSEEETSDEDNSAEETSDEDNSEESNESISFGEFKHLFEDDDDTEGEDADTEDSADNAETSDDAEGDDSETDDNAEGDDTDGSVKLVLTNTDYINDVQGVLEDEYGISKDEFEEMIGGEIVNDSSDDDSEESSDDKSDDSEGDSDADISQEDLDKLFAGA